MKEVTQIVMAQITHIYQVEDEADLSTSEDMKTIIMDGTSADDVVITDIKHFILDDKDKKND